MGFKNSLDLLGKKFDRLTAVEKTDKRINKHVVWKFLCDCGNEHFAMASEVKNGRTRSCGCLVSEVVSAIRTSHGATVNYTPTPTYVVWQSMIRRCHAPAHKSFKDYGGRGIFVCERWHDFENFLQDMGEKPKGLSLDRIDNNKGYSPDNCSWRSMKEQSRNKRSNRVLEMDGQKKCLQEWADEYNIHKSCLMARLKKMSLKEALTKPVRNRICA